jgi:hypothetical protein
MKRLFVVALLAELACNRGGDEFKSQMLTDAERQELEQLANSASSAISHANHKFEANVTREVLSAVQASDAACPHQLDPTTTAVQMVSLGGQPAAKELDRRADVINQIKKDLRAKSAGRPQFADLKTLVAREPEELCVLVTENTGATKSGNSEYKAGYVYGTAYLYSYTQHKVICTGRAEATSSSEVEYWYSVSPAATKGDIQKNVAKAEPRGQEALERDLDENLKKAVVANLRAAH